MTWNPETVDEWEGISFYDLGRGQPLFSIGRDLIPGEPTQATYTLDGRTLIWMNADGSVILCDLVEINRGLTGAGMGW